MSQTFCLSTVLLRTKLWIFRFLSCKCLEDKMITPTPKRGDKTTINDRRKQKQVKDHSADGLLVRVCAAAAIRLIFTENVCFLNAIFVL